MSLPRSEPRRRGVPLGFVIAGLVGAQFLVTAVFAWKLVPGLL